MGGVVHIGSATTADSGFDLAGTMIYAGEII